jgi:subtilase-type serine protease
MTSRIRPPSARDTPRILHPRPVPLRYLSVATLCTCVTLRAWAQQADPQPSQSEYDGNWGLKAIQAQAAYDRGITGAGIKVGIIDTGVDFRHPELSTGGHAGLQTVIPDPPPATGSTLLDGGIADNAHGTEVAGIIAAAKNDYQVEGLKMHGVAYNSRLASAKFTLGRGLTTDTAQALAALEQEGVKVINLSLATLKISWKNITPAQVANHPGLMDFILKDPTTQASKATAEKGILLVWGTGNDGEAQPSPNALLPYFIPEVEDHWLAVTATNSNNTLWKQADRCGAAAAWCLAAPGESVFTTTNLDEAEILPPPDGEIDPTAPPPPRYNYAFSNGTSLAAPHVTGAIALAMERFPYMSAAQIREVILTTATDLGAPGVDEEYGHGLLNVAGAMRGPGALRRDFIANLPADRQDTWSNDVGGPGALIKQGEGTLTLDGSHTHTGALKVAQGQVNINGQMHAPVFVDSSGRLGGTGTLNAPVMVQGTLAPASHGGTLTVNAPLALLPGSRTVVNTEGTAGASRIRVNGAPIALGGTLQLDVNRDTRLSRGERIAVMSAEQGFTGAFDALQQPAAALPKGSRVDLLFNAQDASLVVSPDTLSGQNAGGNAAAGAQTLNRLREHEIARRPGPYNSWLGQALSSQNAGDPLYRMIGGQIHADSFAWGMDHANQMADQLTERLAAGASSATETGETRVWIASPQDIRKDRNGNDRLDTQTRSGSLLLGWDRNLSARTRIGLALGWNQARLTQSGASANVSGYSAHLYSRLALAEPSGAYPYLTGQIGYADLNTRSQRHLPSPWSGRFNGNATMRTMFAELGIGLELPTDDWSFNPSFSVRNTRGQRDAIRESATADADFALISDALQSSQTHLVAQLRAKKSRKEAYGQAEPYWRVGYQYALDAPAANRASLAADASGPRIEQTPAGSRKHQLMLGLGANLAQRDWKAGLELTATATPTRGQPQSLRYGGQARIIQHW